jgi:hypothetical protein
MTLGCVHADMLGWCLAEDWLREDLNKHAPRVMAVFRPIKGFFRLSPGKEVRLLYSSNASKLWRTRRRKSSGTVLRLRSRNKERICCKTNGVKRHWVFATHALTCSFTSHIHIEDPENVPKVLLGGQISIQIPWSVSGIVVKKPLKFNRC